MEIKENRLLKLKMITAINLIRSELKLRNLDFTNNVGLFEITIKGNSFFAEIDGGEEIQCWIRISKDNYFDLCENGINISDFIKNLTIIISNFEKFYKLKENIDNELYKLRYNFEKCVGESGINNVVVNDDFFDDMIFENLITCYEI